jgi:hypothetical protein
MVKRDTVAMEEGAKNCKCFIAIVTDNGKDSYFSREMCRNEIQWALQAERKIVPVCAQDDKKRVKDFIDDGKKYDIDFSEFNFVVHHARIPLL